MSLATIRLGYAIPAQGDEELELLRACLVCGGVHKDDADWWTVLAQRKHGHVDDVDGFIRITPEGRAWVARMFRHLVADAPTPPARRVVHIDASQARRSFLCRAAWCRNEATRSDGRCVVHTTEEGWG